MGILIRGGAVLEEASRIDTVVFDKTGTLTVGEPSVHETVPLAGYTRDGLLELAASAEMDSEHPIAYAIRREAELAGLAPSRPDRFEAVPGHGLLATVDGHEVIIGKPLLMENHGIDIDKHSDLISGETGHGRTVMVVASDGKAVGVISLADTLRPEAVDTVSALHEMGMRIMMITGDNKETAESIARDVGIDEVIPEVLPQEKEIKIAMLQSLGHKVCMVGDGINDAPALAKSDLGIALGAGTDIAKEASDITLVSDDLGAVVDAINLSRRTFKTIKGNLFWAFGYNTIGIPIAAGVLYPAWGIMLNPMIAAAAMALSSVSVVTNSLRLRTLRI